jgi:2-keto-3-deoxy-L-rhamnonate aldolase RhmA
MTEWPGNFPRNRFKQALSSFHRQIGLWSGLCSPIGAEIIAGAGFDWIVIDGKHAPNDIPSLLAQLHAMRGGSAEPVFRVPWNDPVIIKRALDVGARSLLVPFVQNAEEARKAVAAARYPPLGIRGVAVGPRANDYGRIQRYQWLRPKNPGPFRWARAWDSRRGRAGRRDRECPEFGAYLRNCGFHLLIFGTIGT